MAQKITIFFILGFLITGFAFLYPDKENIREASKQYSLKKVMEKEFQKDGDSFFKPIFSVSRDMPAGNFFMIDNTPKMFGEGIFSPEIVYIDSNKNMYITDVMNQLIIFDSAGTVKKRIPFTEGFQFDKLISKQNSQIKILTTNRSEQRRIQPEIFIITNGFEVSSDTTWEKYSVEFSEGNHPKQSDYKIGFSGKTNTVFNSLNGRYINPLQIIIFKFAGRFRNIDFSDGVSPQFVDEFPKEFTFQKFDVSELENSDYLFLKNFYMDNSEDIFLWGLASDDISEVETKNFYSIVKISNPKYIVWKLEK